MPNIEVKVCYPDHVKARRISERLGAVFQWRDTQIDTYFTTEKGKLKLRETTLNGSELIPYSKPTADSAIRSDYAVIPVQDPRLVKQLLAEVLGVRTAVKKTREVYLLENVRIHLDEVPGLGNFLEFEAVFDDDTREESEKQAAKVKGLMQTFEIGAADIRPGSYPDLMDQARPIEI